MSVPHLQSFNGFHLLTKEKYPNLLMFFGNSDVGDNVMLVILKWWQIQHIDDRNIMLVIFTMY